MIQMFIDDDDNACTITFIPASSKLSRLMRPREAQNRVCVVSHKLSTVVFLMMMMMMMRTMMIMMVIQEKDDDDDDDTLQTSCKRGSG